MVDLKTVQVEQRIEDPRPTEALLVALDSSVGEVAAFSRLREAAFRVARTRVIYPVGQDDLVGVLQAGSELTKNNLADQTPDGYVGIVQQMPLVTASVGAVRAVANINHDKCVTNLLNVLDVAGDMLATTASTRSRIKRLLIFTSSSSALSANDNGEDLEEFTATCDLYRDYSIQVNVILSYGNDTAAEDSVMEREIQDYDDSMETDDEQPVGNPTPADCFEKAKNFTCSKLLALCKTTGGYFSLLRHALAEVDAPYPRSKRAMSKFTGLLNIADILQIPVKRFTYTSEVKAPAGTKLSWKAAKHARQTVRAISDTNYVKAVKDDKPLGTDEIIDAYHYGPNLVPIQTGSREEEDNNEVEKRKWSLHLNRSLDVIGFVRQTSVPQHYFMSSIDIVIPLKEVEESVRMLTALVLAMSDEKSGMLARSVMPSRGGAPELCYLWPNVEKDMNSGIRKNCFLFATQLPMREDVRDLPFASLEDQLKDVSSTTFKAMNQFISSSMLPNLESGKGEEVEEDGEEEEEGEEGETHEYALQVLDPPNIANPNLHWFHLCIMHRVIKGPDNTIESLPIVPNWHAKLLDPMSFLKKRKLVEHRDAIQELTTSLPILPARQKNKRGRRSHIALNANQASIGFFLPDEDEDTEHNQDGDAETGNQGEEYNSVNIDIDEDSENEEDADDELSRSVFKADSDAVSDITDLQISDVGDTNPIEDFTHLVKKGKFKFAALSLQVVIRRLIRDNAEDVKAMRCLQALREACLVNKESRIFNEFARSLINRCERKDLCGNRTTAFFQTVGANGEIPKTLCMIPPNKPKKHSGEIGNERSDETQLAGEALKNYEAYLNRMNEKIARISSTHKNVVPLSEMND